MVTIAMCGGYIANMHWHRARKLELIFKISRGKGLYFENTEWQIQIYSKQYTLP
jgi:hypothetical protein